MTEEKALLFANKIKKLCEDHAVWCNIEYIKKPQLDKIIFKEISIKINRTKK